MSINNIKTVDIAKILPEETFIIDTNVLYFLHSGYYSSSYSKGRNYSNFIQKLVVNKNVLKISTASVQELLFGIENLEYKRYCELNSFNPISYTKKDFRADTNLRNNVLRKLKNVVGQLELTYNFVDCDITKEHIENFLLQFSNYRYDPIDYFVVDNMKQLSYINFITDDSDFKFDSTINIFTIWMIKIVV